MSSVSQPPTNEKLIVSLVDTKLDLRQAQKFELSELSLGSHPTSLYLKVPRQVNLSSTKEVQDASIHLCEMQSLSADFGSFLMTPSNTVVGKDSTLYLTTCVDPLFLVLQHEPASDRWQPWDQIVEGMDATLRSALPADRNQLMHLFARMPVSDDEIYYKFSVAKSLGWLQKKFARVQETLEKQQKHKTDSIQPSKDSCNSRSSVASNFHLGKQATESTSTAAKAEQEQQHAARKERIIERCRADALQIVCEYLNETWKLRFLTHVNLESSLLEPPKPANKSSSGEKRSGNVTTATDLALPPSKKSKTVVSSSTVGLKKLAKVNTKGMKKMSAFFSVKKENIKTTN